MARLNLFPKSIYIGKILESLFTPKQNLLFSEEIMSAQLQTEWACVLHQNLINS